MAKIHRDRDMIHFSGRRHTKLGIASTVIGLLVVVGFIAISIVSAYFKGAGSMIVGIIGFLLFALAILGFVLSIKAFKQHDIFYRFPVIGVTINGLMIILLLVLYVIGLG